MGEGLEKDPVVKELVLLACGVQLGQLQAPLGTHVLGRGVGGSGRLLGPGREWGTAPPSTRPPEDAECRANPGRRRQGPDLLTCSKRPM